jgi:2-carboxy-1,4-naphthoquinone phytyltransferase
MTSAEIPSQPTRTRRQLWFAAIKPPMYTVAIIPITVGTAIAVAETQNFQGGVFCSFLGAAIAIVAWINISNDVFDADTGIDVHKAESVVNLTGNRTLMFWIGNSFLALGILGILAICWGQQDWTILGIVLLCCFLGYTYQGPPFRLGYLGLGEIICFVCFGPLALSAAYYSQTQSFSWLNLGVSGLVGALTSLILFCSHFHQVADDVVAGKKSPVVRLGTQRSAQLLGAIAAGIYGLLAIGIGCGWLPISTVGTFLSAPIAWQLWQFVTENHDQPAIVRTCKYLAVRLHFVSGLLLSLGFLYGNFRR